MSSIIHNVLKSDLMTKAISLTADTIKVALFNSSFTPTAADTAYSTTNELATANGYTQGGATLAGKTVTGTTTQTWDATDVSWTATGAGFTARYALLYDTTNSDRVIACIDFGVDKICSGGGSFSLVWDATGILVLT